MILPIIHEVKQTILKVLEVIYMVTSICIKDKKKIVLEGHLDKEDKSTKSTLSKIRRKFS